MSAGGPAIDKRQARRSFERAADVYDGVAVLQREVGARLLERLDLVRCAPGSVLDVGAGTGAVTARVVRRYPRARVVALDFALPMLQRARRRGAWWRRPRCVCADAEQLPVGPRAVDLVFSNLTLQWCNGLEETLREFLRVSGPGGVLMFSTFGPDTLRELRECWSEVDGYPHVSRFADMHEVGDAMLAAGWSDPVVDVERFTLTYQDLGGLMRELKVLGAHNVTVGRRRGLTGKGAFRAVAAAYERRRREGRLPATYEVVYGHAWAPSQTHHGAEVAISADLLRRQAALKSGRR